MGQALVFLAACAAHPGTLLSPTKVVDVGWHLLVGERLRVIDWAWPTRGADWLDTASLVVRLIQAGHTPLQAEQWAQRIPAWRNVPDAALWVFLRARLSLGERQPHRDVYNALATWQEHRSNQPGCRA